MSMISSDTRIPIVSIDIDGSYASGGSGALKYKRIVISNMLDTGLRWNSSAGVKAVGPYLVSSKETMAADAGSGSIADWMGRFLFLNDKSVETYVVYMKDAAAAVVATAQIAISGSSPAVATVLSVWIFGIKVSCAVPASSSATTIAAALAAAITVTPGIPCTASAATGTITLTMRNKGAFGNNMGDVRVQYDDSEKVPAGLTVTITQFTNGAGNPNVADAIALLPKEWYQVWNTPYADSANMAAIDTELELRFGPAYMIDGLHIIGYPGSLSDLVTYGDSLNSKHHIVIESHKIPSGAVAVSAAATGVVSREAQIDPARPFQSLALLGILPPRFEERFDPISEDNTLLWHGIATTQAVVDKVNIQRLITTYRLNGLGAQDISYLDATRRFTLMYLRFSIRNRFATKYPRHKLAKDGTNFGPDQRVITPSMAMGEVVDLFSDWEKKGLVENFDQFKKTLFVEKVEGQDRLNLVCYPDLIDQFIVMGMSLRFLLGGL